MQVDEKFLVNREKYLFLENHPQIRNFWLVDGFDPQLRHKLSDVLSRHRYLSPFNYEKFAKVAKDEGYEIEFLDDPTPIFDWVKTLRETPEVEIRSNFPGTVNGLLPFQVQGFNFTKDLDGSILNCSTGTGKTLIACALTEYHHARSHFDVALWIVKAHNKVNSARMIERFIGRSALIVDGSKSSRLEQWRSAREAVTAGLRPIVIANYEAFRHDFDEMVPLIENQEVFIVWDEMPSKLRSRQTQLYRNVAEALYTSKSGNNFYPSAKTRPSRLRQVMLSATPIENSPEDFFNAVRLLDPSIYGSVRDFNNMYIGHRNLWGDPDGWKNLDLMGALASQITFQVDKDDPEIARQFPKVIYEDLPVSLSPSQQRLYNHVLDEYQRMRRRALSVLDEDEVLSIIQILQYVCDYPRAVVDSAARWVNGLDGSEVAYKLVQLLGPDIFEEAENVKFDALTDILASLKSKVVIFAPYNESVLPYISEQIEVPHVVYHGGLSMQEKQAAQDHFTDDPNCRVFLSSDAGSDSINLECADTVIHYSLPWNWSTLVQRENRIHRITSAFSHVRYYTLLCADTVEDRRMDILIQKYNYHKAVLKDEISNQQAFLNAPFPLQALLAP